MSILKNLAQLSTDMFVRVNEEAVNQIKKLKIDDKYSDEMLRTVHHIRDKNELYLELGTFWNSVKKELDGDMPLNNNSKVLDALNVLEENTYRIYDRNTESQPSQTFELLSGMEKFSDEMAANFIEFGLNAKGRKSEAFDKLVAFQEDFQKLMAGKNEDDKKQFISTWNTFRQNISNL